jgi:hypothetical protein
MAKALEVAQTWLVRLAHRVTALGGAQSGRAPAAKIRAAAESVTPQWVCAGSDSAQKGGSRARCSRFLPRIRLGSARSGGGIHKIISFDFNSLIKIIGIA